MNEKKILIKGIYYEIGDFKKNGYEKDKCYFKKTKRFPDGKYFIFRGKLRYLDTFEKKITEPGIYYIKEIDNYKIKYEDGLNDATDFLSASIDAIYKTPTKEVKVESSKDNLTNSESYISPDTSFFKPEFDEDDNLLTRIIKQILQEENWTSRELSERVETSIELSNLKRRLVVHKKLSFEGFAKWLYLLKKTGHFTVDGKEIDLEFGYKNGEKVNVKE